MPRQFLGNVGGGGLGAKCGHKAHSRARPHLKATKAVSGIRSAWDQETTHPRHWPKAGQSQAPTGEAAAGLEAPTCRLGGQGRWREPGGVGGGEAGPASPEEAPQ